MSEYLQRTGLLVQNLRAVYFLNERYQHFRWWLISSNLSSLDFKATILELEIYLYLESFQTMLYSSGF